MGYVSAPETLLAPRGEVHILYDFVPSELTTPVGQNRTVWTFLVSTGHSKSDVFAAYEIGSVLLSVRFHATSYYCYNVYVIIYCDHYAMV